MTIQSVLSQSYTNWEMIIVDDSSIDNTLSIIREGIKNDPRIKLINQKINAGAAVARNKALDRARGRFIAFLDSDDIWLPDKLEMQVNFMLRNNSPISFTSYELINDQGLRIGKTIKSVPRLSQKDYLKNTIIGFSTSMIDTEIVGEYFRFINIRTRQDTSLWISLLGNGFNAYGLPEVLVKYRVHDKSISSNRIKAAKQVWNLYFNIHKLGLLRSIYFFTFYAINAVKKRI